MRTLEEQQIFGVKINAIDIDTALNVIDDFIHNGKSHIVVTADSSSVVMAQKDNDLRKIINDADLVTPDSIGILWAAKRFGIPLPERVPGIDVVERLCRSGAKTGLKLFLLGAAPGIAETAGERLTERYPGLQIAGTHHGFFKPEETDSVIQQVNDSKPDVLLVAMGIPLQEKWISQNMDKLKVPVSIGVGGTLDVISGHVKRAPRWMQRCGLEWFYRLASNPRKIKKVMALPIFVGMVLRSGRAKRG